MPRLMNSDKMNNQVVLRRSFCENSDSGRTILQMIMIHAAQAHWPKTRVQKYSCSARLPLHHATWNSGGDASPTTLQGKRLRFPPARNTVSGKEWRKLKD